MHFQVYSVLYTYTGRLCSTGLARTLNSLPKLTVVKPLLAVKWLLKLVPVGSSLYILGDTCSDRGALSPVRLGLPVTLVAFLKCEPHTNPKQPRCPDFEACYIVFVSTSQYFGMRGYAASYL